METTDKLGDGACQKSLDKGSIAAAAAAAASVQPLLP